MEEKRGNGRTVYADEISFEPTVIAKARPGRSRVQCLNISQKGFGVITNSDLIPGEVLKFFFPLKGYDLTLPVIAEVVWTMQLDEYRRAGLRYLG